MHKTRQFLRPDPDDISEVRALRRKPGDLRLLVFGTDPWLTWSVARCLIRERYHPVVLSPARGSGGWITRWNAGAHVPFTAAGDDAALLDQIEAVSRAHDIDVVLPVDLPAVLLASRAGAHVRSARIAAVPLEDTLLQLTDPWQFASLLATLDLPHPKCEVARDAAELRDTRLTFPITTRPIANGPSVSPRRHENMAELACALLEGELDGEFPLFARQCEPGRSVGFAFLARHGRLMAHAAFEPRGPDALRFFEGAELRTQVARLIDATSYHGLGQIEARYDFGRAEYQLLELRPCFWESHLFAERAGMNFPDLLARMPDIGPGAGFMARPRPVKLGYYERTVGSLIRLAAQAQSLRGRRASNLHSQG